MPPYGKRIEQSNNVSDLNTSLTFSDGPSRKPISDATVYQDGEEWIAFANQLTGDSHLVSFDDFLDASWGRYLQPIKR